ncbi:uncharacterized protein LOC100182447 [Ciona intestinalis]
MFATEKPSFSNNSGTNITDGINTRIEWIVSTTFSAICFVSVFYITIALSIYAQKKRLCICQGQLSGNGINGPRLLSYLSILGILAEMIYFAIGLIPLHLFGEPACSIGQRITISCGVIVLGCVYFGLWFRIYTIFYHEQIIKKNLHIVVRAIGKISFVFFVVMLVTNTIVFMWAPAYETTSAGCLKVEQKDSSTLKWSLLVSSTVLFQATLLFMFIYPLWLHRKDSLVQGFDSKRTIPIIKRVLVTSIICILSDGCNAIFALTNKNSYWYIRHLVYGLNILVNLLAFIFSFVDWKKTLFPIFGRRSWPNSNRQATRTQTQISRLTTISR